jgi:UDP-N-acetylglucosamine--N-acetylmuramyl-(pentapeptide) pyrophosphoryl-undecaprenol N-acetylglucosamine transferase
VVTGYPVRPEIVIAAQDRRAARRNLAEALNLPLDNDLPLVLVHGASQGARSINRAVWGALPQILPRARLLHCIGTRDWTACADERRASVAALPPGLAERYHPLDYLHDAMALALAGADLAVARAGASVLGEFPVARLPAILVPLPFAGVNQRPNAQSLAEQGAALVVEDDALEQELAPTLLRLLADHEQRRSMEEALATLAKPDAAEAIARELHRLGRD